LLGDFPGAEEASEAYDVSADGRVVVGVGSSADGGEAFRWTTATGLVSIGDLPGGILGDSARGTSSDGSVIVGSGVSEKGFEGFYWSAPTGMVGLGDLPGGGFFSEAHDVSADGSIVVGRSVANSGLFPSRAFRWTAAGGMIALPDIPGIGPPDIAQGISGDGNVIVGAAISGDSAVAFAWDEAHGSRSVAQLLQEQGVDLGGFELGNATAASYDGLTVVGIGIPQDRNSFQAWIAHFDEGTFVPEPNSICLASAAAIVILVGRWWPRRGQGANRSGGK
jgi:probable HAF family extracellular repeat protein